MRKGNPPQSQTQIKNMQKIDKNTGNLTISLTPSEVDTLTDALENVKWLMTQWVDDQNRAGNQHAGITWISTLERLNLIEQKLKG